MKEVHLTTESQPMLPNIFAPLKTIAYEIGAFITSRLKQYQGFGCRSYYGETFSLALLAKTEQLTPQIQKILSKKFDDLDRNSVEFHWEFNRYALTQFQEATQDNTFSEFILNSRYCETEATNWVLLRCLTKAKIHGMNSCLVKEIEDTLKSRQLPSGLILDDTPAASFQYHCFSLALLAELYELSEEELFKNSFLRGLNFIRQFICLNGDTLFVGRGQQQLFGYASLIYSLAQAHSLFNDSSLLQDLELVLNFFLSHRRNDGSFPLVLRKEERKIPSKVDLHDPDTLGWYSYNNYFDYLAFSGLFLHKASKCLTAQNNKAQQIFKKDRTYSDSRFFRVSMSLYDAVITKTGGYITNDLALPYIVTAKGAITPCYGGEQFTPSLYSQNDIPLPYFPQFGRTLRSRSKSWLTSNALYVLSPLGLMKRTYTFLDDEIQIHTRLLSPFPCFQQYLFREDAIQRNSLSLSGNGYKVFSDKPLLYSHTAFCATGKLYVYRIENKQTSISIRIES